MDDVRRLGDTELLARVIGSDGLARAAAVLGRFEHLHAVGQAEWMELVEVPGLAEATARRLLAAVELGRRAAVPPHHARAPVEDADDAFGWLGPGLQGLDEEELHALYLDRRRRPIALRRLTRGSDQFTVVDPKQVFRPAVQLRAAGVVLAHNHPSGDATPSPQDVAVTRRVAGAGRVVGVELVDHLVIGLGTYTSLRGAGELDGAVPVAASWTA